MYSVSVTFAFGLPSTRPVSGIPATTPWVSVKIVVDAAFLSLLVSVTLSTMPIAVTAIAAAIRPSRSGLLGRVLAPGTLTRLGRGFGATATAWLVRRCVH